MSPNSYGLTDKEIVYELSLVLHSRILDILGHGMYTTVYFVALFLTLSRGDGPRTGSAVLISVLWILITIHVSINWAYIDNIYIRHGETRETQLGADMSSRNGELYPLAVTNSVVTFISILLADLTMIWRCWVLYGKKWLVITISVLSLATLLGAHDRAHYRPRRDSPPVSYIWRCIIYFTPFILVPNQIVNLELAYMSATVLTNIFCSIAIICRIAVVSGWRKSIKTYHGLMEILIESSVLYTVVYVNRIGLQIYSQYCTTELNELYVFPQALGYSITGIAPTLIIARVAAGYVRPDDSWMCTSLPHRGSTMRSLAESLHFAQLATGTVTDTVDLERNFRSHASVALEGDESRRESPKQSTGWYKD